MLPILYQDDHIIAVHKPSGLLVHRSVLDWHETRFAMQIVRDQIGQKVYPVHRLDKGTSGVLLFALSPEAARHLGQQFESHTLYKRYQALVRGFPEPSARIDYALKRRPDEIERAPHRADLPPQTAVTDYKRLQCYELPFCVDRYPTSRYALVQLEPHTGRRHQLRRHLKHIAHPIIGDASYGKGQHNRLFTEHFGSQRLLLACTVLEIRHPENDQILTLSAPLAEEFTKLLHDLKVYEVK